MPFGAYKDFADCVAKNSGKSNPKAYCATIERAIIKESMNPILASEVIDTSEAIFSKDETTGRMTARIKIIQAGRAKNPRNYRSEALRKAAKEGIYNGLRMFVDHSSKPPTKRSISELVSAVETTDYDPKADAIFGNVEIFNPAFFDYAQRAQKYMGVSANHRIRVTYVQEGRQTIEDVHEIVGAHSVDWVIFPSAGGEAMSFARESEGADEVEWTDVTLDSLTTNAPQIVEALKAKLAAESKEEDPPEGDPPTEPDENKSRGQLTKEDIAKIVAEQFSAITTKSAEEAAKRAEAAKQITAYVNKSGLPPKTQARLIAQFSDAMEYVEADAKEAVDDAKAELKEAGAGPRITGMGPTGGSSKDEKKVVSVRESVEAAFGIKVKATTTADPKKES